MDAIIRLNDYSSAYPEADDVVVRDIDLEIRAGECHCLSGPSGSGKTPPAYALAPSRWTEVFLVLPVL
ncbi:MAG: hypothetical protein LLG43_07730 [Deltaproteobacteria bacterium]|nr:hypothetical protein [Deltaproteobacteria bacterium]